MSRIEIFELALQKTKAVLSKNPTMFPLESVVKQINYLIDVERGAVGRDDLKTINIGQIAARDIDDFDEDLADILHTVSAEVRGMTGS